MRRIKRFLRQPYNLIIVVLAILNILPLLAPIFMYWGWEWAAKPIYFIYSFTCHQFAHRSLHIHDHQCAWCARDTAIWGSLLLVAILVKQYKVREGIRWYWLIPFTLPILLDGGIQTIATVLGIGPNQEGAFYISTNTMRALTGGIFGTGLGMWMLPALYDSFTSNPDVKAVINWGKLQLKLIGTGIGVTFLLFLAFVQLWQVTSPTYPPANFLDFQVKAPPNKEFFVRREHGACPVDAISADPLGVECFF